MKKLRLELDALAVESFDMAGDTASRRGTVRGNEPSEVCKTRIGLACPSANDYCEPSYVAECWWTTNPMLDCLASNGDTGCPTG